MQESKACKQPFIIAFESSLFLKHFYSAIIQARLHTYRPMLHMNSKYPVLPLQLENDQRTFSPYRLQKSDYFKSVCNGYIDSCTQL